MLPDDSFRRLRTVSNSFSVALIAAVALFRLIYSIRADHRFLGLIDPNDVWLLMICLQSIVAFALLVVAIKANRMRQLGLALVPTSIVFSLAYLLWADGFDGAAISFLESTYCLMSLGAWAIVIGGIAIFCFATTASAIPPASRSTRTGQLNNAVSMRMFDAIRSRSIQLWLLKLWVLAFAFTVPGEVLSRIVVSPPNLISDGLDLPDQYPPHRSHEFTIAAVGGSTMKGFPYSPKVSIPAMVAAMLERPESQQQVTVQNLAENGMNLRLATEQLQRLTARPNLLLVYTGHNEFFHDMPELPIQKRWGRRVADPWLEWSRIYQVVMSIFPQQYQKLRKIEGYESKSLRAPKYSRSHLAARRHRFRLQLEQLAKHLEEHEIRTLWFIPAASEGIFAPSRSVSYRSLSKQEVHDFDNRIEQARGLMVDGRFLDARKELQELSRDFGAIAETEYLLGLCYESMGEKGQAKTHFQQARDVDGWPVFATSDYRDAIQEVATAYGIETIDASEILNRLSPTGLRDRHVIHDNVHPTLRGYFALSLAVLKTHTFQQAIGKPGLSVSHRSFREVLDRLKFNTVDLALAYERIAHCVDELGKTRETDHSREWVEPLYLKLAKDLEQGTITAGENGTEAFTDNMPPGVRLNEVTP